MSVRRQNFYLEVERRKQKKIINYLRLSNEKFVQLARAAEPKEVVRAIIIGKNTRTFKIINIIINAHEKYL